MTCGGRCFGFQTLVIQRLSLNLSKWPKAEVLTKAARVGRRWRLRSSNVICQAVALVRDHIAKGANGIKLFTGSYQGGGEVANLPLPIAKAAVAEALPIRHRYRLHRWLRHN